MEENNKKNARIFYLTLAVVLTVVVVVVIATTVARRAMPDIDGSGLLSGDSTLNSDQQTGVTDDEDENTLPTFALPLQNGVISMDYSDSVPVFSPTMNDYRTHLGVDIEANLGDSVLAIADGIVTNVWDDPFMGKCVSIEHSGNAVSFYKNLDPVVSEGIVIGASVSCGDVIGSVGESAMNEIAEEPHLHFEMKVNDVFVDPKNHVKFPTPEINPDSNGTADSGNTDTENSDK